MSEAGKRLFVGIRVSVGTANALAGAAETLARRARDGGVEIRWVAPVSYHVTLKFLGWTHEATIGAVIDALEAAAAGTPRFTLRCARLGGFPSLEKASVVWAGIEEQSGALDALAKRIEINVARLGFEAEKRAFHPHVTIGRLRETRPVREVVLPVSEQMFGDTRVDALTLFESETKSSGSVYSELRRIDFKTPRSGLESEVQRQTPAVQLDATTRSNESAAVGTDTETDDGWPRGHHHDDL
ncbi:MAG: RNA 2',3'-cyclic phosphodiesterase [Myxococcota bacterium]|nr:RNA 2',3'-cyclic phosphodiesterase [Deltaproteobacteria bacterium]MDQ3334096.1 RNA 2',3'-cyclic phosphodiesterase [Myxococcota bacterium]